MKAFPRNPYKLIHPGSFSNMFKVYMLLNLLHPQQYFYFYILHAACDFQNALVLNNEKAFLYFLRTFLLKSV